ncbi:cyclin-J-like [Oppia nitens]|uniref:cyclin-J-like n=1 Tax=Oppia nitens TaxID=1686743 RepID=UPI0023DA2431|nr:cyclin-J-like [Oppia nitens]
MSSSVVTPELEYSDECVAYLMNKEKTRRDFIDRSPQKDFRYDLVQRLHVLCECLNYSTRVKHLSVYLLDYFMDNHMIIDENLELTVVCCLAISVKTEESDRTIKYKELLTESDQYSMSEILKMESIILEFFEWQLLMPTAATYIDYFSHTCLPEVDLNDNKTKQVIDKYLDKTLDIQFYRFRPSLIAAATIYYTRNKHQLVPYWPRYALNITKYTVNELMDCINELKKFDFLTKPSKRCIQLNDSGFDELLKF